ncbi:MAG: COX15/CtaA family protein, partial [Deltaproteobacteria bacterium]|nr:COX15/CtaA family protein [Deltaproteobacteria bacterium]
MPAEPAPSPAAPGHRTGRLALAVLGYTLLVILFGAVVRITGSGAGCGQHWPTCQGELLHLPRSVETAIELTHRVTSGASLIAVVLLLVRVRRDHAPGDPARRWAWLSFLFMVTESLVGAALVLLRLVGRNDSPTRAVFMAVHLVNTSLLAGALLLAARAAATGKPLRLR